jgi:hypothetical protein
MDGDGFERLGRQVVADGVHEVAFDRHQTGVRAGTGGCELFRALDGVQPRIEPDAHAGLQVFGEPLMRRVGHEVLRREDGRVRLGADL